MSATAPHLIDRLRALPVSADRTWQGGLFQIETTRAPNSGDSPIVRMPVWVCADDDAVTSGHAIEGGAAAAEEAMVDGLITHALGENGCGYLPGRVEVRDESVAVRLRDRLEGLPVSVVCRPDLEQLDALHATLDELIARANTLPALARGKGVTIEHVRSFAEAAVLFFRAAPWRELDNFDLLRIESPAPPPGFEHALVLGAGGDEFGLGFHRTADDYWNFIDTDDPWMLELQEAEGRWLLTFDHESEMAVADRALWTTANLPVCDGDRYPTPMLLRAEGEPRRPDATELVFLEGLLRALAESTGAHFDTGRWSRTVTTASGPVEYTLALPEMLDPPDRATMQARDLFLHDRAGERRLAALRAYCRTHSIDSDDALEDMMERLDDVVLDEMEIEPVSPLEAAQFLCYDAYIAIGRHRLLLARRAMETCPDCADAWLLLAERSLDPTEAHPLLEKAVAAGERAMAAASARADDEFDPAPELDVLPTYRARVQLATCLEELDRPAEAAEQFRAAIELSGHDDGGLRHRLLPCLLRAGRVTEAMALLDEHPRETHPLWSYGRAIVAFGANGDTPAAQAPLRAAAREHPLILDLLTGAESKRTPSLQALLESCNGLAVSKHGAALACARELEPIITTTPGAREWLERQRSGKVMKSLPKRGGGKRRPKSRKRR